MSEKLYGVDHFYTGDFAQILTGVYNASPMRIQSPIVNPEEMKRTLRIHTFTTLGQK